MKGRALAHFDGRKPCLRLVEATMNLVPERPVHSAADRAPTGLTAPSRNRFERGRGAAAQLMQWRSY